MSLQTKGALSHRLVSSQAVLGPGLQPEAEDTDLTGQHTSSNLKDDANGTLLIQFGGFTFL